VNDWVKQPVLTNTLTSSDVTVVMHSHSPDELDPRAS